MNTIKIVQQRYPRRPDQVLCSFDCFLYEGKYGFCFLGWDVGSIPGHSCPGPGTYRLTSTEPCSWDEDDNRVWYGDCGIAWRFSYGDIKENKMVYCPGCGRNVEVDA